MSAKRRQKSDDYFVCRHCGAELPAGAKSCRKCGSDDETGWSESELQDDDDGDDDEYQEFLQREFPDSADAPAPHGLAWQWRLTAIVLLAVLVYFICRGW